MVMVTAMLGQAKTPRFSTTHSSGTHLSTGGLLLWPTDTDQVMRRTCAGCEAGGTAARRWPLESEAPQEDL